MRVMRPGGHWTMSFLSEFGGLGSDRLGEKRIRLLFMYSKPL